MSKDTPVEPTQKEQPQQPPRIQHLPTRGAGQHDHEHLHPADRPVAPTRALPLAL